MLPLSLTLHQRPQGDAVTLSAYLLDPEPDEPAELVSYTYPTVVDDGRVLREMLESQVFDENNVPLIGLPSARIAKPGVQPSRTQSIVLVTTKKVFDKLPASEQQGILRDRCILVQDISAEPAPGFTVDTLSRYRHPYLLSFIEGTFACYVVPRVPLTCSQTVDLAHVGPPPTSTLPSSPVS